MNIQSIKLTNFRGFKSIEEKLSSRLNVFIGKNGSGKTSLLDAISMNFNHGIHRLTSSNPSGGFSPEHLLNHDDINNESKECNTTINYMIEGSILDYTLKMSVFNKIFNYEGDEFEKYFSQLRSILSSSTDLPVVVYYNVDKDFGIDKTFVNQKNNSLPQLNAYRNASNKELFSFKDFAIWFRLQEDIENEIRLKKDIKFTSKALQVFRFVMLSVFKNLGNDVYEELSVIRAKPDEEFNFTIDSGGELFIKKNGKYLKISQLSSGEKNLIFMVCDLASRILQLNPSLVANESITSDRILALAYGVVLIDEVELHLHPSWQRKIVSALINIFPGIQFIITTHSENVIISILDLVKDKYLNPSEVSVFNLMSYDTGFISEKKEINVSGQIEGGLSSFYQDQLEDIDNFFNI